jgi:hypothetical protein
MPRLGLSRPLVVALVLFALPVAAGHEPGHEGAPADQYDAFTYQDRRIKDRKTQLLWERGVSAPIPYGDAVAYCASPTRVPTLKELLTLVDEQPHLDYEPDVGANVQKMIDPSAFSDETPVDSPYWTSSISGGSAFTVDFKDGMVAPAATTAARRVRCVRHLP